MIDPEEMEALASQLEEALAADPERDWTVTPWTPPEVCSAMVTRRDAQSRMRAKMVDAVDALREAAAECRRSHGL